MHNGFLILKSRLTTYYVVFFIVGFFLFYSMSLENVSFCDAVELTSIVDSEAPGSPPDTESSPLTEEEKNLQQRDEYIVKIGTGVIICTIIVNVVLYYVLIYSKTN